jgi:hypothetical protein
VFKMCVKIYAVQNIPWYISICICTYINILQDTSTSWLTRPTHTFFLNILVVLHEVGRRAPDYRPTQVELAPTALREVCKWGLGIHMAACTHTTRYNNIHRHKETDPHTKTKFQNK